MVDVVVRVGGWEHECCGPSYERGQVVDVACMVVTRPDATTSLDEVRHEIGVTWPVERVRGRVVDVEVVHEDGTTQPILRVPDGSALCGFGEDDGHLEDPWTGEVVPTSSHEFRVTVRVPGDRAPGGPSPYRG
ncbi:hypothetical protein AB2L27_00595 [Kineococcus sp. LSe6-4]|uniref:Uncharacterized protein n=1 Tax=Kineococcus halophytocola TaxID=3234027 RepID=A0ABV4GVB7_9ACTN